MPSSLTPRQTVLLIVLVAATLPYFWGLGDSSLWDANEAFYAETPREMLASRDFVNPRFNFQPRFNKPVLPYWTVAAIYRVAGVSERAERMPIAIGALVLVLTTCGLGYLVRSPDAGLLAGIVLATTPRFLMFARRIIIDVHLAMFAALTLLCFVLVELYPARRRLYLPAMYVAAGLGTLTKGPVAVLLPGLVFFLHLAFERRLGDIRHMMLPTGALIGLAVVLPWYVLVYLQNGWTYIQSFVVGENLLRYAQTIGVQSRGMFFYLPVMLGDLFPWSVFLPVVLVAALGRRPLVVPPNGTATQRAIVRLLALWIAVIVVFFSFSRTKQDLYILPIVPAEAALIGALIAAGLDEAASPAAVRLLRWLTMAAGLMVAVTGLVLLVSVVIPGTYPLRGMAAVSALAIVGGILAGGISATKRAFAAVIILAVTFTAISSCFVSITLPDFERYKPVRPLATVIQAHASERAVIGYYKFAFPSMVFYLRRPVLELFDLDELKKAFSSDADVFFLITADDYEAVKEELPTQTYVLDRRLLFDVRLGNFLEGTALPEVLLISNRPAVRASR